MQRRRPFSASGRRSCSLAIVLLVVVGACGSTATPRASDTRSRTDAARGQVTGDAPSQDPDAEPGAPARPGEDRARPGRPPTGASGGSGGSSRTTPGEGPGREAGVRVGLEIIDRSGSFGALGVESQQGARERAARAVADHVNRTGGMGGRRLELLVHLRSDTSGTFESQAQQTCSSFAEDRDADVVASGQAGGQEVLVACLARHDVPTVVGSIETYDDTHFDRYPTLYAPAKVSGTRWSFYADALVDRGYFDGGTLGIVRYDTPGGKRIRDVVVSRLARSDVRPAEELALRPADSVGGLSGLAAEVNNGLLRFRERGVDRVMFVATSGAVPFFFLPQAEGQGYRPRYAFTSDEFLNFIKDNVPPAQLRRAVAVGWWPIFDVAERQDPGGRAGAGFCFEAFAKAGVTFADRLAEGYALNDCDMLLFVRAVLERAPRLGADAFRAAAVQLGDAYGSAAAFATAFGSRRDGAAAFRALSIDDGCGCWVYDGAMRRIE